MPKDGPACRVVLGTVSMPRPLLWCVLPNENEHGDPSIISVRPHFSTVFQPRRTMNSLTSLWLTSATFGRPPADLLNHLPEIA